MLLCMQPAGRAQQLPAFPVETIWTVSLSGRLAAPPHFTATTGFVPVDDSHLLAYDLSSGRQLWIADLATTVKPASSDTLLFVAVGAAIVALRLSDGTPAWRAEIDSPATVSLVCVSGWLIAATASGSIVALDGSDGRRLWRHEVGVAAHAPPAIGVDRVYVPLEDDRVVALRLDSGAEIWSRTLGGRPGEVLALDDRLFVGSLDNYFYALIPEDGRVAWRFRTGNDVVGLPIAEQRRVYFVALDNVLRALDRRSGSQVWRRPLSMRPTRGAVPAGELLVVSGSAPTLSIYQSKDGQAVGELKTAARLVAAPAVVPGETLLIVVMTDDISAGTVMTGLGRKIEAPASLPQPGTPAATSPDGTPTGPAPAPSPRSPNDDDTR